MSKLGKILLIIAAVGGVAAAIGGYLVLQKRAEDKANLAQMTAAKQTSDKAAAKAKQDALDAQQAKADSDQKLTDATAKVTDLNTQLDAAKKEASDAKGALDTATAAAKAAQDNLDKLTASFGGKTPEQVKAEEDKAQADVAAAQS